MIGILALLAAGFAVNTLASPRARVPDRLPLRTRDAVGACCSACAQAQALGQMPYGHACTSCGMRRLVPPYASMDVDRWCRRNFDQAGAEIIEFCRRPCMEIQPVVESALRELYPIDGYGDEIDWSQIEHDGGPLDQLRSRVTCRVLAGMAGYNDIASDRAYRSLGFAMKEGSP